VRKWAAGQRREWPAHLQSADVGRPAQSLLRAARWGPQYSAVSATVPRSCHAPI